MPRAHHGTKRTRLTQTQPRRSVEPAAGWIDDRSIAKLSAALGSAPALTTLELQWNDDVGEEQARLLGAAWVNSGKQAGGPVLAHGAHGGSHRLCCVLVLGGGGGGGDGGSDGGGGDGGGGDRHAMTITKTPEQLRRRPCMVM